MARSAPHDETVDWHRLAVDVRFEREHEGNFVPVPGLSFEIRYPNGDYEVDVSGQLSPPVVGDTIRRNGRLWKVITRADVPAVIVRVELAGIPRPLAGRAGLT